MHSMKHCTAMRSDGLKIYRTIWIGLRKEFLLKIKEIKFYIYSIMTFIYDIMPLKSTSYKATKHIL